MNTFRENWLEAAVIALRRNLAVIEPELMYLGAKAAGQFAIRVVVELRRKMSGRTAVWNDRRLGVYPYGAVVMS